ncbi:response regulator [Spirosoma sp. SC4-14]|uniref:response regulator n=1 Tax=Spirosoma sp. SC4-14 TaxID=3128900 RepID=UPI0030CC3F54
MDLTNTQSTREVILLIDDNQDAAMLMERMLQLKGYRAHVCHDGQTGLEAAERLRPAVIIMDLAMPDMDGFTVCQRIRAQPWGRQMMLVALSGYSSQADQELSRQAGFNAHLIKPADWPILIKLLEQGLATDQG